MIFIRHVLYVTHFERNLKLLEFKIKTMREIFRVKKHYFNVQNRTILASIMIVAFFWALLSTDSPDGVIHTGGWESLWQMISNFFTPELEPKFIRSVVRDTWTTIAFAVTGMTVAIAIGIPLGIIASGVLVTGRIQKIMQISAMRGFLAILRAIHEIVWALLFVIIFGLSPIVGVLAIGIPYGGILGRVLAERLQDVPDEPLNTLRSNGASEIKVLLYGRIPLISADVVSYIFYRFECAIRAAVVLSFAGLGGLGFRVTVALDDLRFDQMWTPIFVILILIIFIDIWSGWARKRLAL